MKLSMIRTEIDAIDSELAELLRRRAMLSLEAGTVKCARGIRIRDRNRETEILNAVTRDISSISERLTIRRIYSAILQESRRLQSDAIPSTINHNQ